MTWRTMGERSKAAPGGLKLPGYSALRTTMIDKAHEVVLEQGRTCQELFHTRGVGGNAHWSEAHWSKGGACIYKGSWRHSVA
eukprot:357725-Chlamydomonas_euryale.AAC.6